MLLENHEYETSKELVWVVEKLSSPWIGLLFDFGNSMMAWEDQLKLLIIWHHTLLLHMQKII
ncbi:sugar phosphate isomerase/epimerase [Brachyspira hyodysenteriae]|nr:hypothetical protein [Brachyspira hyodysenteriae]MDA1467599.1 sugar phosphate isomerase/epimerase [Brachyspira hyodysenteriae]